MAAFQLNNKYQSRRLIAATLLSTCSQGGVGDIAKAFPMLGLVHTFYTSCWQSIWQNSQEQLCSVNTASSFTCSIKRDDFSYTLASIILALKSVPDVHLDFFKLFVFFVCVSSDVFFFSFTEQFFLLFCR